MGVAIILLAAGASTRMGGRDKLLEQVEGRPLLRVMADRAQMVVHDVIVTLPAGPMGDARATALDGMDGPNLVRNTGNGRGMGHSIAAGVRAAFGATGVMILPADMPDLTSSDLKRLIDAFDASDEPMILRAGAEDGTPGHPVIFPSRDFGALSKLTGDQGARPVLATAPKPPQILRLEGRRALVDLDTAGDWARWRSGV